MSPEALPVQVRGCTLPEPQKSALAGIENWLVSITQQLLDESICVSIRLARAPKPSDRRPEFRSASDFESPRYRVLSFPGKTPQEAWSFTALVRVLHLLHVALMHNTPLTKRDIFYKDPLLFTKQSIVDRLVDDIARTLQIPRSSLNVMSAAKGIMAGALRIFRNGTVSVNASEDREGILIPNINTDDAIEADGIEWILVVEKEAVFRSIVVSELWPKVRTEGLVLTAKGYPDRVTRALLKFVHTSICQSKANGIPIYALVDFDPDGVGIFHTYQQGSAALAHEQLFLDLPSIQWIGIKSCDLSTVVSSQMEQKVLMLSDRDRGKATSMLKWRSLDEAAGSKELRLEIQRMLMLNVKAEIEILEACHGGLLRYLTASIK